MGFAEGVHAGIRLATTMQEREERRMAVVRDRNYRDSAKVKAGQIQAAMEQAYAPWFALGKEMPQRGSYADESGELSEAGRRRYQADLQSFHRRAAHQLRAASLQAMNTTMAITATEPDNPCLVPIANRAVKRITGFVGGMLDRTAAMNRTQLQADVQRETTGARIESSEKIAAEGRALTRRGQDIEARQGDRRLDLMEREIEEEIKARAEDEDRRANQAIRDLSKVFITEFADNPREAVEQATQLYYATEGLLPFEALSAVSPVRGQPGEGGEKPSAEQIIQQNRERYEQTLGPEAAEEYAGAAKELTTRVENLSELREMLSTTDYFTRGWRKRLSQWFSDEEYEPTTPDLAADAIRRQKEIVGDLEARLDELKDEHDRHRVKMLSEF